MNIHVVKPHNKRLYLHYLMSYLFFKSKHQNVMEEPKFIKKRLPYLFQVNIESSLLAH